MIGSQKGLTTGLRLRKIRSLSELKSVNRRAVLDAVTAAFPDFATTKKSRAVAEYFGMDRTAVLYVFDNPRRREHILLSDVEKDAKRERANQAARELAFALALEFDARYKDKEVV